MNKILIFLIVSFIVIIIIDIPPLEKFISVLLALSIVILIHTMTLLNEHLKDKRKKD